MFQHSAALLCQYIEIAFSTHSARLLPCISKIKLNYNKRVTAQLGKAK
jgi:hypothetical protein